MKLSTSVLIALAFYGGLSWAQERPATSRDTVVTSEYPLYEFEPVEVTATRAPRPLLNVPYAINVIGMEAIQRGEATLSLNEALRGIPGVVVNNRQNLSWGDRIAVRGVGSRAQFGVRGIKILLDGIPLTRPDGQSLLDNVDLGSAGRIEVIRGPASSLYGNAAGGVINIETQIAPASPLHIRGRALAGSYGLHKWQGKILGQLGRISYMGTANRTVVDGYREHSAGEFTKLNVVGLHQISARTRMTIVFNLFNSPYLLNPGSLSKAEASTAPRSTRQISKKKGAGRQAQVGLGGIALRYQIGEDQTLETALHGSWGTLLNSNTVRIIDLDRWVGGARLVYRRQDSLGSVTLHWVGGAEFEWQKEKRAEHENKGLPDDQVGVASGSEIFRLLQLGMLSDRNDHQEYGLGPFAELQIELDPRWALTLGSRYDHYTFKATDFPIDSGSPASDKRTMTQFSPMVGLTFRPRPTISLYGNLSTAFQTPTRTEFTNRPTGESVLNPDLKPERLRSFELGLKGISSGGRLTYDLAAFTSRINDMIIPYQVTPGGVIFYRNAGETQNRGVEAKLRWELLKGVVATAAYTFMDFEFRDLLVEVESGDSISLVQLAGNDVPGVPPNYLFAGIAYQHSSGLYAEFNFEWADKFFASDLNGPEPGIDRPVVNYVNDAYRVIDLRLGMERRFGVVGVELFGGINNLLDERYNGSVVPNAAGDRFFEPAPGRNWYAGLQFALSPGR